MGLERLPAHLRGELSRYLECGVLAHGFARVRCPCCGAERRKCSGATPWKPWFG